MNNEQLLVSQKEDTRTSYRRFSRVHSVMKITAHFSAREIIADELKRLMLLTFMLSHEFPAYVHQPCLLIYCNQYESGGLAVKCSGCIIYGKIHQILMNVALS